MPNAYAGIGSRETPAEVLALMQDLGAALARAGWLLRSGAAPGADSAFEAGADLDAGAKEVFIPWEGFQKRRTTERGVMLVPESHREAAEEIASKAHPRWTYLKVPVKKLHTRNVAQVLGARLEVPVRVVLCWTVDGAGGGGTGQALRIAKSMGITIYDLGNNEVLEQAKQWVLHPEALELALAG